MATGTRRRRTLPLTEIRSACDLLTRALVKAGRVERKTLEAIAPTGAGARDPLAWLTYHGRLYALFSGASGPAVGLSSDEVKPGSRHLAPSKVTDEERKEHDRVLIAALTREPGRVERAGQPPILVYPKSYTTLLYLHGIDVCCGWVMDRVAMIEQYGTPEQVSRVPDMIEAASELSLRQLWIAATPGPGMPFDPRADRPSTDGVRAKLDALRKVLPASVVHGDVDRLLREVREWLPEMPDVPEWLREVESPDVLRALAAFREVNGGRISVLLTLLKRGPEVPSDERAPGWADFIVGAAEQMGRPPYELLSDTSLAEVLIQVGVTAEAHQRAMERAKAEAAREMAASGTSDILNE